VRSSGPTIVDVAARAGVSKSLVSLVMRGSSNVSDEKRTAVLEAAAALGYRPNAAARTLVRQRSHIVGVLLSDLHNPFFTEVVGGIFDAARRHDYQALINTGERSVSGERTATETLLQLRTDGVILVGTVIGADVIDRVGAETPTVLASRGSRSKVVDSVVTDDNAGARLAVDHLVALGHRRIAHVTGGRGAGARNRLRGFERAMTRHGLTPIVADGAYTEAGGIAGAETLFARRSGAPTAVLAANDLSAIGVLEALSARGLSVPDEVSVVGYDDTFLAALEHIGLTSVRQERIVMGITAVELLIERIDGGRTTSRHVVLDPQLTVRTTTAPPPASKEKNR
jgi:DNA-binding LacI/PurR family transcriptional regulator